MVSSSNPDSQEHTEPLPRNFRRGPFSSAVAQAAPGAWFGPVRSAYGWHLVRVESRPASSVQPFAAARPQVREDETWKRPRLAETGAAAGAGASR